MSAKYPTTVVLSELPSEGQSFSYSRQTGELTNDLTELIGNNDYSVQIHLRPMGNVYEITGEIHTSMNLDCSRCGEDVAQKIDDRFQEIIVIMDEKPRAGHSGYVGQGEAEEGPYCNYVQSNVFSLTDFVREHLAAAEPYTIYCGKPSCDELLKRHQATTPEAKSNPFEALKNFVVKPQRD